jgi:hypothetical protein
MLNEVKHPPTCHAERSEASMSGFLACARHDTKGKLGMKLFVMLNEVKHPPTCHAERSEASMSGFLAIARHDKKVHRLSVFYGMTKEKCGAVQQNLHIICQHNLKKQF